MPAWADISHVDGSYVAKDRRDGQVAGVLRYTRGPQVRIDYIAVARALRRQGLGAALVQALHRDHPSCLINPGNVKPVAQGLRDYLMGIPGVAELAVPGAALAGPAPTIPAGWEWLVSICGGTGEMDEVDV